MPRKASFTVTVTYADEIINPGHLLGGMIDEVKTWNSGENHYEVDVSEARFETEVDTARREALDAIGMCLDYYAHKTQSTSVEYCNALARNQSDAVTKFARMTNRAEMDCFIELQREAYAAGHGQI